MFLPRPPLIAALIALSMVCGVFLVVRSCARQMERPVVHTINAPTDANTVWRADAPLSYDEAVANGKVPMPLPKEATHIQYVDFYEYGFMHCVRFEAPVKICQAHAAEVMKAFNQRMQTSHNELRVAVQAQSLNRAELTESARLVREEIAEAARASWFDPDKIVHGEMWGRRGSHTPVVMIDTEKGVFYYLQTD